MTFDAAALLDGRPRLQSLDGMHDTRSFCPPYSASWGGPVLFDTDWANELTAYGTATAAPGHLREITLFSVPTPVLYYLTSAIVHQSTHFPATEPVTRYLLPACLANGALQEALRPFWIEWLDGARHGSWGRAVEPAALARARAEVRQCATEGGELELLWERMDDNDPIPTLMAHEAHCAQLALPQVASMYPDD